MSKDRADADVLLVVATFPDEVKAGQIGTALVSQQLAACVNVIPAIRSIYRWENEIHSESECLAILKTTRDRYEALAQSLADLHPYDVPEIIAVEPAAVLPAYARWVAEACGGGKI
ncbi:divalent-cation tolerance protein CutA [soil metagenome]